MLSLLGGLFTGGFGKIISNILRIPVPLVVVVAVLLCGWIYHWADKASAIRSATEGLVQKSELEAAREELRLEKIASVDSQQEAEKLAGDLAGIKASNERFKQRIAVIASEKEGLERDLEAIKNLPDRRTYPIYDSLFDRLREKQDAESLE